MNVRVPAIFDPTKCADVHINSAQMRSTILTKGMEYILLYVVMRHRRKGITCTPPIINPNFPDSLLYFRHQTIVIVTKIKRRFYRYLLYKLDKNRLCKYLFLHVLRISLV